MLSSVHRADSFCERWSKLEMTFDAALESVPAALREPEVRAWEQYAVAGPGSAPSLPAAVLDSLPRVWAASDFVMQSCVRAPALLADVIDSGDMLTQYADPAAAYVQRVTTALAETADATALAQRLWSVRRRVMLSIAWRDLAGWAELGETLHDLSALAAACVDGALHRLDDWQRVELGVPLGMRSGAPQGLVVIGMGKLGAAGPLVFSFVALEEFYQTHGREWERYACIKAAPVAGDAAAGAQLMQQLRPFVFRRYLDFGAYRSLREMLVLFVVLVFC